MRRRWLLSLLCLSVLFLSLVQLTRARGEFKVNETTTRLHLEKEPAEVMLSVENSTGETLNARVEIEILDPQNNSRANTTRVQPIRNGSQKLSLPLPVFLTSLKEKERRALLLYRLHYRVSEAGSNGNTFAEGIVSLSEITPDLFDLRVATSELAREGSRYHARVQATHPITRRPAANVRVDGEITLEDDNNNNVKLRTSKTTDSKGYALLDFVLPARFPQFPHSVRPSGGELEVIGRRGDIVAVAKGDVLVDQFERILAGSDKPLYQPGQVMHLRALLFSPSKRALANQDTLFKIFDPEGTTVFRSIVKTSRFGVANTDWTIPENTRLGDYRVSVGVDGGDESGVVDIRVRISRYDLPNFTVSVETDRSYYLPGQNAEVKVRADYLFGQPVVRGRVRVVREDGREWNYREQKWDIQEGAKYEGETDAKGFFVARINLEADHRDLKDDSYDRFNDLSYAAYFTDPTTNRTEQRRFDLRVTREAIHVYVIENDWSQNKALPLKFYISTFYADGLPARCKVNVAITDGSPNPREKRSFATLRTNRYGLVKVSDARLPSEFDDESDVDLVVSAVDSKGLTGSKTEEVRIEDEEEVRVESDKAIYRPGEPITAFITSNIQGQTVVVDLLQEATVIRSERVKLHDGRASVNFAYKPDLRDKLTIVAYVDFPGSRNEIGAHTILYPRDPELKVNVRTSQASYRPGEDAQVDLSVRTPEGRSTESALGVVVFDKAVEERFRTDLEFGWGFYTGNESLAHFLGLSEHVAGVTLRDLQRLDMSKIVRPELDLVAEVLLSQRGYYFPTFYGGDQYERDHARVFGDSLKEQLKPIREALKSRYARTSEYPKTEQDLRRLLLESRIDFNTFRDPWGILYRPFFSVFQFSDDLTFESAGADKRFDTDDDFTVDRLGWPYFRPVGEVIDGAVSEYHDRTGQFIRELSTLREELTRKGFNLDQLRDRWDQPYRFEFDVNKSNYVIKVRSGGPDAHFGVRRPDAALLSETLDRGQSGARPPHSKMEHYLEDDFIVWTSSIDYFKEPRTQIGATLDQHFQTTKSFPETAQELREALRNSQSPLDSLRDPWKRPYYATFKTETFFADRVHLESRANLGEAPTQRTVVNPVTRIVRFITLRSSGADGKEGTVDDFSPATFTAIISEQPRGKVEPQAPVSRVVFSENTGAIHGLITDSVGAAIPGVTVTATRSIDRIAYQSLSDDSGKYGFTGLPPGVYELRFDATGFMATVITNVLVSASNITEVNASLQPGQVVETVTVTAASESFMTDSSVNASYGVVRKNVTVVTKSGSPQQISTPRLREYFPETLVWQPSIETNKQGRAQINFKLADNITTWKMLVIGSTEDGQIGTTEKEFKAFQPFFVEHDPPRVLTEGDEISLPVTVRNYLERTQKVDLEIKPENWFSLLGPASKQTDVVAGDATRETFDLRAIASIKDGKQRITATGSDESDAIEKPVTVHPDGEELSVTAGDILDNQTVLELNIPETMITNSRRAELKIYPNLMAHVVESVEGIMQRPYGCGEQAISSTYPSLLLLRHYKKSDEAFPLRGRAERYLKEGYSRLLNYRDESGGFTYWGHGQPDVALTAYAVRFLTAAADVISVDQEVIDKAREWLIKQQKADGSWSPHESLTGLADSYRVLRTAYVTRVLASERSERLKSAFNYLSKKSGEIDEPYLLASYALAAIDAGDSSRAKPVIDKLRSLAHSEGTGTYWSLETNTPFYGWGRAGRVETTALAVQALARYCGSQTANCHTDRKLMNSALLFLLKQKDRYGVWYSTQATINVLDAMLTLLSINPATQTGSGETDVLINGRAVQTIQIPVGDRLNNPITLDIAQFLNKGTNRVELKRPGSLPLASVQAVVNFYVPWSYSIVTNDGKSDLDLLVKFDKTAGKINDEITCTVNAQRFGFRGYGMMLAEIGLPPGAEVDRSSLQSAVNSSNWAISQYDVLPDRVVVYLWPRVGEVKFNFKFRPRFGLNAKTAPSIVYDYYNPESRAVIAPVTFKVK